MRVALVYGATAFAILQAADLVLPRLGLPDWTVTFVLLLTLAGFPIALIAGWAFELTPDGVRRTESSAEPATTARTGWLSLRTVLLVGIALLVAGLSGWFARGSTPAKTDALNSIAVLPFANLGGRAEDEHFSDGLAEELLNVLARIDGLKVSARTSAFAFKGRNIDVRAIGDSLDVSTVLEGSVRRDGETVRVTAQLINVADGYHIWSDQFDAQLSSIFQVQEQIARSIAEALRIKLGRSGALAVRGTTTTEAHDLYLLGLSKFNQRAVPEALNYFERAIAIDSNYAQAWSGVALANAVLPMWANANRDIAALQVRRAAERAIRLDDRLAEPYAALCQSLSMMEWRWEEALRNCDAAIGRNPNFATAHHWRAELTYSLGRFPETDASYARALELDPRSMIIHVTAAMFAAAKYDTAEAKTRFAAALRLDPVGDIGLLLLPTYLEVGDTAGARAVLFAAKTPPDLTDLVVNRPRDPSARTRILSLLMPRDTVGTGDDNLQSAEVHALVGDNEGALRYLEKAFNDREFPLPMYLRDPQFMVVRNDPRFRRIVKEMGLEPYYQVRSPN